MNPIIENILSRRSVRAYSEEQIKQEDMEQILKAGLYAPSGCNTQSWHFTVIQNKDLMKELNTESKKILETCEVEKFQELAKNENYDIFYKAPTTIIISGESSAPCPREDCAAASENMILTANSLGIGSCWIGLITYLFLSEKVGEYTKKLGIPEGYAPYYAITLGYKKYPDPKPHPRRANTVNFIK